LFLHKFYYGKIYETAVIYHVYFTVFWVSDFKRRRDKQFDAKKVGKFTKKTEREKRRDENLQLDQRERKQSLLEYPTFAIN